MKKILSVIGLVAIVSISLYFVYTRLACKTPYQEEFLVVQNSSGVVHEKSKCSYVGFDFQLRYRAGQR